MKITIVAMVIIEENTPHSPKQVGEYRRDKIGVTMIGNTYMMILLEESLAVFITNALFFIFFNVFKICIYSLMVYNTSLFLFCLNLAFPANILLSHTHLSVS